MANYKLTKMPWKTTLLTLFFLCTIGITNAQENLNQYDEAGKRHGTWRGYYDDANTLLKYEGQFEHGKEIGVFKFYEEGLKNPVATKTFDPGNATVAVKFLTQRGHVVSEGQMKGKHRVGTWKYYHKNSDKLMMTEVYEEDQLNGEKLVYYENGQIAEKANYIKGKLEGEKFLYSEKGVVLEHLLYENGELHGKARIYNGKGELVSEGNYKRDRHHGIWKYYEDGKLKETKEYK
jgi:antitoxin component YwqK of YwqJK toxin-antitoxin module